jgi:hypothetical protein
MKPHLHPMACCWNGGHAWVGCFREAEMSPMMTDAPWPCPGLPVCWPCLLLQGAPPHSRFCCGRAQPEPRCHCQHPRRRRRRRPRRPRPAPVSPGSRAGSRPGGPGSPLHRAAAICGGAQQPPLVAPPRPKHAAPGQRPAAAGAQHAGKRGAWRSAGCCCGCGCRLPLLLPAGMLCRHSLLLQ